jgi:hypothetical protein
MRRLIAVLVCLLTLMLELHGQIPKTISYQGVLCDVHGNSRPDATYTITFRLYDAATEGTKIWEEAKSLQVIRGVFYTLLGDLVPFDPLVVTFDKPYWLGLKIGTDAELSPRIALGSTPYSFNAIHANTADYATGGPWQTSGTNVYYNAGNVGIGTNSPIAKLDVENGSLLLNGTTGGIPPLGGGTRLMWIPVKAAFRAGWVSSTEWDDANVGTQSTAMGHNAKASGYYSTAMGSNTVASGVSSTAMGNNTKASGDYSTVMGWGTKASGERSTAMGNNTTASGPGSTAMGSNVSTNGMVGSFVIGDDNIAPFEYGNKAWVDNMFMARFDGGYALLTDASNADVGAKMLHGESSWSLLSDSAKKENYRPVNGERSLAQLRGLKLGSWNYKGQDPTHHRHYGPMAQEFFAAFGHDDVGVIGNDTLIASADIDGVMMMTIQALEKRTAELRGKTAELQAKTLELEGVKSELADLKARLVRVEQSLLVPKDFTQRVSLENGSQR